MDRALQFHWDREGTFDERSSCWIRTMQPWAGPAWGHQFIPRVGMEVVVVFEGGDPDKPMVIGSVYNGTHPPSFKLPQDKTRSGIRTQSVPFGGGFNELSFEDAAGREEIFVRAHRDQREEVGHDHRSAVGHDRSERVAGDKSSDVGGKREDRTRGDHHALVEASRTADVRGSDRAEIGGDQVTRVAGRREATIERDAHERIGGAAERTVTGASKDLVRGDRSETTSGTDRRFARGDLTLGSAGRISLEAAKGISLAAGTGVEPATVHGSVAGDVFLQGTGQLDLVLREPLRIRVGETLVEIGREGVAIRAKKMTLDVEELTAATAGAGLALGKKTVDVRGGTLKLAADAGAALALGDAAELDGSSIKLGSKGAAEAIAVEKREEQKKSCPTVDVHLFDHTGKPVRGAVYEASCFGWIDAGEAPSGVVKVPDFPDVERVHLKWSRPPAERPKGADGGAWEFEKDVYLKAEGGPDDEKLRRHLHNLGFEEADGTRAVQRYQEATGAPTTGDRGAVHDEVAERHQAASPVPRAGGS